MSCIARAKITSSKMNVPRRYEIKGRIYKMKRKLFAATLCASMVAGLVVVPTVAHADESKGLIGAYPGSSEMEPGRREHEERAGSKRL